MRVLHQTCAGMDVHKKDIKVCLVTRDSQGQRQEEIRSFRTMTRDVLAMRAWLQGQGCTIIAIESTGVYWKPIFNLFEGDFTVLLVNPSHIKQVPGRKTDVKDCRWIAELLEHGLLRGSFIPPVEMRDQLRELMQQGLCHRQRALTHLHTQQQLTLGIDRRPHPVRGARETLNRLAFTQITVSDRTEHGVQFVELDLVEV